MQSLKFLKHFVYEQELDTDIKGRFVQLIKIKLRSRFFTLYFGSELVSMR